MINIKFENENGALRFCGGRGSFPCKIIEITGLSFVPKQYTVNQYANIPGQMVTGGIEPARTITMSVDVQKCDSYTLAEFNKILSKPGTLYIYAGSKRRKIQCRCEDFTYDKRRVYFQPLVIQFICDNPFFEDVHTRKISLFEREDLIKDNFTLPCVFSTRIQRVKVINAGQQETEPVIYLYCIKAGESEECSITITNHTTGVDFVLNYKMSAGEEICIDFAKRLIFSNLPSENNNNGNLIVYMSAESYMNKFKLIAGINDIECAYRDEGGEFAAVCEYSSKYIEAVI